MQCPPRRRLILYYKLYYKVREVLVDRTSTGFQLLPCARSTRGDFRCDPTSPPLSLANLWTCLVSRPMAQAAPSLQIRRKERSQLLATTFRDCALPRLIPSPCITFCITKLALQALSSPRGQDHRVRSRCTYLSLGQAGGASLRARRHSPAYTCASATRCLRTAEKPGQVADNFPKAATWSS